MTIHINTLASSSKGNCYHIHDDKKSLLIEAGISITEIKKGVNFALSKVDGCLISHAHQDHCKALYDLLRIGVSCYMSIGTANAAGILMDRNCFILKSKRVEKIGGWSVIPFPTYHDTDGSLGFLIKSNSTGEKILFATDTAYISDKFNNVDYIMIECNYNNESLEESFTSGKIIHSLYKRILETHFGLENVIEFLKANDLSLTKEIHLIHISETNANRNLMESSVRELTGIPVYLN